MEKTKRYLLMLKNILLLKRGWLRGSYLEYLIAFLIFLILVVVYTNFVAFNITTQVFTTSPGDGTGGFLWYNFAQPGIDPNLHHSSMVNYPYGEDIGGPTFLTYWGLWIPIRIFSVFFGAIAGVNLFMFFGYILSALSMYWLIKRLTNNIAVAYFASFAVAFAPYTIHKSLDHIAYILSYIFIFIIAGFIGLWVRPTKLRAVLLGAVIALAFYTDGYYILLASVLVGCLVVAGLIYSVLTKIDAKSLLKRIRMLCLAALVFFILLLPVIYLQVSQGGAVQAALDGRRSNISVELHTYRANLIDLIIPASQNPFFDSDSGFQTIQAYKNLRSNPSESTNYIGFTLLLLSAIGGTLLVVGLILKKKTSLGMLARQDRNTMLIVGSIALVAVPVMLSFMFSPEVTVFGHTIPLPGKLFIHYDITLWRVMSRFFVPLHVIIVLFSALSLWLILKTSKLQNISRHQLRLALQWAIVGVLTLVLAFEYATTVNRPSFDFTKDVNKAYVWLRNQKSINAVVELPVVSPLDARTADYVTNQVVHTKKLVNSKENQNANTTNVLGGIDNPETIDWAYERGAQAVITHYERCVNVVWGVIIYKDDSSLKNAICIYKIINPPTHDDDFIKYGTGFIQRPNADNQQVAVISSNTSQFTVTNDAFLPIRLGGTVNVQAVIESSLLNDGYADVSFVQGGKNIKTLSIQAVDTPIAIQVSNQQPIDIVITLPNHQQVATAQYVLKNVVVTAVN